MFKKLFTKRIGFRIDDQLKAMNDEIMNVESEYKLRLAKPNKQFMHLKRHFQKDDTKYKDETIENGNIEIDENKILEEKKDKVKSK
jgi:phage host-nuclease inhibitor protein Gam